MNDTIVVSPVIANLENKHIKGVEALRSGSFKCFSGFAPDMPNRSHVSLTFSTASDVLVRDRLMKEINGYAQDHHVRLFSVLRDFPMHATIGEGVGRHEFCGDNFIGVDPSQVVGVNIFFDHLVIDGPTLFLATSDIPQSVLEYREAVNTEHVNRGLNVNPIKDLLHITVARVLSGGYDHILDFADKVEILREEIMRKPLFLTVVKVNNCQAAKFLSNSLIPT